MVCDCCVVVPVVHLGAMFMCALRTLNARLATLQIDIIFLAYRKARVTIGDSCFCRCVLCHLMTWNERCYLPLFVTEKHYEPHSFFGGVNYQSIIQNLSITFKLESLSIERLHLGPRNKGKWLASDRRQTYNKVRNNRDLTLIQYDLRSCRPRSVSDRTWISFSCCR